MEIVVGNGCTGYGIKSIDCDPAEFLHKFIEELTSEGINDFLIEIVNRFGVETYFEHEPCETCGDYYSETTLRIQGE